MTVYANNFQNDIILLGKQNLTYPNLIPELGTIYTALNSDSTTRDLTLQTPPAALKPGADKTRFTNAALLLVNRGKAGNLANVAMANVISSSLGLIAPPVVSAAPVVTGTPTVGATLSCTTGAWQYSPTSYAYQWRRGATPIAGATASTYVLQALDSGTSVSCQVTATNPAGSASALSNAIAVTLIRGRR